MKKLKSFLLLLVMFLAFAVFACNSCEAARIRAGFDPSRLPHKYLGSSLTAYRLGGLWGIYDSSSKAIYSLPLYTDLKELESNYILYNQNGRWGILKYSTGDIEAITPPIYDSVEILTLYHFKVSRDGKYGWIKKTFGDVIQEPVYAEIHAMEDYNLVCVCDNNNCGIARTNDGKVVKPIKYPGVFNTSNASGYFTYYSGGAYGVVDLEGKIVAMPKYRGIKQVTYDAIYITDGEKKLGLLRMRDGKQIAQPIYDKISKLAEPGFYKVKKDGKWGAIDYDGNLIYECKYGPLEMNKMVRNYPDNQKFKDVIDYNYYYNLYLQKYYYLEYMGYRYKDSSFKELLSDENKSQEIKDKTTKLMNKYKNQR